MLRLWLYCSYSGSPVGFQLGNVEYDGKVKKLSKLASGKAHPLLERLFYTQGVHEVIGVIPESNIFLLAKKLPAFDSKCSNLTMNFAWETTSQEWFPKLRDYFKRKTDKELFAVMSAVVTPNTGETSFGFDVENNKLLEMLADVSNTTPSTNTLTGFKVKSNPGQAESLAGKLHLGKIYPQRRYRLRPLESGWYLLEKTCGRFIEKKTGYISSSGHSVCRALSDIIQELMDERHRS